MKTEEFKVFRGAADMPNGRVVALRVPGGASLSRKEIDDYTQFVGIYGAKGLAYIKVNDNSKITNDETSGLQSPIVKFLSVNALSEIIARTGAENGDLIFFGADKARWSTKPSARCASRSATNAAKPAAILCANGVRCGWWTSRCLNTTKTTTAGPPATIRSPARNRAMKT